jgi:hypothetical protein
MNITKLLKDVLNAMFKGTKMGDEQKQLLKWVLIGITVAIVIFIFGYSCGSSNYSKQAEVIQQIKNLVNGI